MILTLYELQKTIQNIRKEHQKMNNQKDDT